MSRLFGSAVAMAIIMAVTAAQATPQTPPGALALYPKAAHDSGLDGRATVTCGLDEHLRHVNCRVASEDPPKQGFGEAALALAAMTPPNPNVTTAPSPTTYLQYLFCTDPDFIDPNPLEVEHLRVAARVDRQPTAEQTAAAMPPEARTANASARVWLNCTVETNGAVDQCSVVAEAPSGAKLSDAALSLAPFYHASPATSDGKSVPEPIQLQVLLGPNPPLPPPPAPAPTDMICRSRAGLPPLAPRMLVQRPTAADMARAYPRASLRAHVGGFALLHCRAQLDGSVTDCTIMTEAPDGQGFGTAAIALMHVIRYTPAPQATSVTIPIRFDPPP